MTEDPLFQSTTARCARGALRKKEDEKKLEGR